MTGDFHSVNLPVYRAHARAGRVSLKQGCVDEFVFLGFMTSVGRWTATVRYAWIGLNSWMPHVCMVNVDMAEGRAERQVHN